AFLAAGLAAAFLAAGLAAGFAITVFVAIFSFLMVSYCEFIVYKINSNPQIINTYLNKFCKKVFQATFITFFIKNQHKLSALKTKKRAAPSRYSP
ncbi:MAG: hypothetical protein Q4E52_03730, partial [Fibrobacter sp.]|nr:hypothetical protein [Fibrobacter sp.]